MTSEHIKALGCLSDFNQASICLRQMETQIIYCANNFCKSSFLALREEINVNTVLIDFFYKIEVLEMSEKLQNIKL